MDLLEHLNRSSLTVVVVTHDDAVARRARRILRFNDGMLSSDSAQDGERDWRLPRAAGCGQ